MDQLYSSILALAVAVFILQEIPKLAGGGINIKGVLKTLGKIALKTALLPLVILRAIILWVNGIYGRNCLEATCPQGHTTYLWKEIDCDRCHFTNRRNRFGNCPGCGLKHDHVPCPICNHSILRPGRWLEQLLNG